MVLHNASNQNWRQEYLHGNKAAVSRILCFVLLAVVWNVCNEYAFRCGLQCDRVLATDMNCILVVCGMHM